MGRTLFCDCCGQDIRNGSQFYRVESIPKCKPEMSGEVWFFKHKKLYEDEIKEFIICAECFQEIGKRVQSRTMAFDFEVEVTDKEI